MTVRRLDTGNRSEPAQDADISNRRLLPRRQNPLPENNARIESLAKMLAARPDDPRAHFGLAIEYERLARWPEVVSHLESYLALTEDQGNAWGRLARACIQTGNPARARAAYRHGIDAASRHGHPSMAAELEEELEGMDED
jgi:E3 SUMO-protein ligase RanBP2